MRKIAYEVLVEVICKDGFANLIMRDKLKGCDNATKGFVTDVVYGTLRNHLLLEYQWQKFADRKVDKKLAVLIDMTLYQCFFTRHAQYATVNEMVALAKEKFSDRVGGFLNAIIRKCLDQGLIYSEDEDPVKKLSVNTSVPEWILRLWKGQYGLEVMTSMAEDTIKEAEVFGRINTLKCLKEDILTTEGFHAVEGYPLAVRYDGNMVATDAFKRGKIVMQDLGSQQIASFVDAKPGMKVLDVCSAPGSKTTMIAALMKNKGEILACDLYDHRLQLVDKAAENLGVNIIDTMQMDASKADQILQGQKYDRILMDVPCSGLGVLKRRPDILLRVNGQSLDEIVALQAQILNSCASLVAEQGEFVYSTCTVNKKENEKQIAAFLKSHSDFSLIEEKMIFPYEGGSDGFYMAKCKKIM